jgi:hypothetical protein
VLIPTDELASESNIAAINWCPPNEVFIDFSSRVRLILESQPGSPATESAASDFWSVAAAQDPGVVKVGEVRGHPAAMADPSDSQGDGGGVEFFEDGLLIAVLGDGSVALSELVRVAESLKPVETQPA